MLSTGSEQWGLPRFRSRIAMRLPRPDDLSWRAAGVDIRHARKEGYRCGGSAQNRGAQCRRDRTDFAS